MYFQGLHCQTNLPKPCQTPRQATVHRDLDTAQMVNLFFYHHKQLLHYPRIFYDAQKIFYLVPRIHDKIKTIYLEFLYL